MALWVFYGDAARLAGTWTSAEADARLLASGAEGVYTTCDGSPVGDPDGDGHPDVALAVGGDPASVTVWSSASGAWSGDVDATAALAVLTGASGDLEARVTAGDLDLDGFTDVATSLPYSSSSYAWASVVYGSESFGGAMELTSASEAWIYDYTSTGVAIAADMGGDGNDDGYADLLGVQPPTTWGAWLFLGGGY
jgi:hypothetical protein